jgi:ligand-binding sensor domain-containing protein
LFSFGQGEGFYRNYTVEDGLPSSEVYFSFQDSKGYMWFATDGGVCRFNGYEFEVFNTTNGLTDNTVFRITEDAKGRIWFASFNGQFCYYYKGKIHQYIHNDKLKNIKGIARLASFYVDTEDNIWLGTLYHGIQKIDANGDVKQMIVTRPEKSIINEQIKVDEEYIVGSLFMSNEKKTYFEGNYTIASIFSETEKCKEQRLESILGNRGVYRVASHKNSMAYLERKNLVWTNGEQIATKKIKQLEQDQGIYIKVEDSIAYIGIENQGISEYHYHENQLEEKRTFLKGLSVSYVYKDNQGGMWFSTLSNGVYYLPHKAVLKHQQLVSSVYDLEVDTLQGLVYIALRNGELYEMGRTTFLIHQLSQNILNIFYDYKSRSLIWGKFDEDGLEFYNQKREKKDVKLISDSPGSFKVLLLENDTIYHANHTGFDVYHQSGEGFYSSYKEKSKNIWCTSLLMDGDNIWIGTNKGILIYKKKAKTIISIEHQLLSSVSVTCLERFNATTFLVGTKSKGVLVMENGQLKRILNESIGLPSNLIRTIHVDNQQTIWLGSIRGVSKVSLDVNNTVEIFNVSEKHGLISEEITDIESIKDSIYVGTTKGLMKMNKSELKVNDLPPLTYIEAVLVNDQSKPKDSLALLTYTENNISIKYEGVNYRSQGAVNYQYRLLGEGLDSNWIATQSRLARYTLLPPGAYEFEVKAENEDGFWSETQKASFTIHPPFWRTWWFILLLILSGGLAVYSIVYTYFKRREKELLQEQEKVAIEKKLMELELKALRSQMNPHFIFNILNSIQHFMLKNNFKETNHYLTQFAKLIRKVLSVSEKKYITIGEELEMLKLYMNLEQMRFENGFDYEIFVGNEVDEDYDEIPSMLIQPYVENAIWHGLMNKKERGKIKIEIELKEDVLFCVIEDNGVGLKEAEKIKSKRKKVKHKSVGMRITKDRLSLINEFDGVNVTINDLSDNSTTQTGTRVRIRIKI